MRWNGTWHGVCNYRRHFQKQAWTLLFTRRMNAYVIYLLKRFRWIIRIVLLKDGLDLIYQMSLITILDNIRNFIDSLPTFKYSRTLGRITHDIGMNADFSHSVTITIILFLWRFVEYEMNAEEDEKRQQMLKIVSAFEIDIKFSR